MKLVSIIMPIYNGSEHMRNAIESCLAQSYQNFEIIIIDDGSTDNSLQIATEYAQLDNRIVIRSQENKGQASARNAGLKMATGEYIQFLDCDDTLNKNCLQTAIQAFEKYSEADFILFGFNIYAGSRLLRTPNPGDGLYRPNDSFKDFISIQKLLPSPCNKLYKRTYIAHLFPENRRFAEDTIFNYQLLSKQIHVGYISDCLYNVQLGTANSVNKGYRQGKIQDYLFAAQLIEDKLVSLFNQEFDLTIHRTRELATICYLVSSMSNSTKIGTLKSEIDCIYQSAYFRALLQHAKKLKPVNKHLCHLILNKKYHLIQMHGWIRMKLHSIYQFLQEKSL